MAELPANETLHIEQVANGFVVNVGVPSYDQRQAANGVYVKKQFVFQSMAELIGFIQGNFSHRCKNLVDDKFGEVQP